MNQRNGKYPSLRSAKISATKPAPANEKVRFPTGGPPPTKSGMEYVNIGLEDQMEIRGYTPTTWKTTVTWICIVLTAGLLRVVFHWKPEWMLSCTHSRSSLATAVKLLLKDQYEQWFVEKVNVHRAEEVSLLDVGRLKGGKTHNNGLQQTTGRPAYGSLIRYFVNKKIKYLWNPEQQEFERIRGLDAMVPCSFFCECQGVDEQEQSKRRAIYGDNEIAVEVQSILKLLFLEVLNPFYVFQVYSIILWNFQRYYLFANSIIVLSMISITITVIMIRRTQKTLRDTVRQSGIVTVCRSNNVLEEIPSEHLVPGDVITIPKQGCVMHCDAVLVNGMTIVNESMLTGESLPVTKTPIPNPSLSRDQRDSVYCHKEHSRHTLFCGTHIIQTRNYNEGEVKAVVLRTGFTTSKGELVRAIMYPKPVDFRFHRDALRFVGFLFAIALIGLVYTVVIMTQNNQSPGVIAIRALDLITITVPPVLPAAMTIGIIYAQRRLKLANIYCISPRTINLCGSINVVCFDKTGTLTEDGIDMHGVVPTENNVFQDVEPDVQQLPQCPTLWAIASCHSLSLIDGQLKGDPLDMKLFFSTEWEFIEPGPKVQGHQIPTLVRSQTSTAASAGSEHEESIVELGVLRQYVFVSSLQRMSVVAYNFRNDMFECYVKGSPEKLVTLSRPETVPADFQEVLREYAQQGYRMLALAYKRMPDMQWDKVKNIHREDVECDLEFLGLVALENRLKPQTTPVISQLRQANIRTVMITGDNTLTALSVARHCGMILKSQKAIMVSVDATQLVPGTKAPLLRYKYVNFKDPDEHEGSELDTVASENDSTAVHVQLQDENEAYRFAVDGKTFDVIRYSYPDLLPRILVRGTVFSRMSPDQKAVVVEVLQKLGYFVGMCGDGANDCGALKAAHAGISLSETEASVASPFTSKDPDITCVPTLIREGRCALVTSFAIFKYMASYSLVQFVSVMILYYVASNITDFEFLYIDLVEMTVLALTFGGTRAYPELAKEQPSVSLLGFLPLFSLMSQMAIQVAAQATVFTFVGEQPWFQPYNASWSEDHNYWGYENAAVFTCSTFQYVLLAVVFAKGKPYRLSMFSNVPFLIAVVSITLLSLYLAIYPADIIVKFLEYRLPPDINFRLIIVGIAVINFLCSFMMEKFLVDNLLSQKLKSCEAWFFGRGARYQYEHMDEELDEVHDWPPIDGSKSPENSNTNNSNGKGSSEPHEKDIPKVVLRVSYNGDGKGKYAALQNNDGSEKHVTLDLTSDSDASVGSRMKDQRSLSANAILG